MAVIQEIRPDILVKGGDYQVSEIVGHDFVTGDGGCVRTVPYREGYSTTDILEKIKKQ